MAMKKKTKPSRNAEPSMGLPSDSSITEAIDNEAAGNENEKLGGKRMDLESQIRDISLKDIELNPDNELFRMMDNEEDIRILAEDIRRNGLLHNLVVYPKLEGKGKKFVLLSGERRYKAMDYLQRQGEAKWNVVKNCHVITTELSENERKVILYSANLQVRGGFADEQIRRKAVAEFVACLQKEPFNLTAEKARKAVKEIASVDRRSIERDLRLENELNPVLLQLLDEKLLNRRDAEAFLTLSAEEQKKAAEMFLEIKNVKDAADREHIHLGFKDALIAVTLARTPAEANKLLEEALEKAAQQMQTADKPGTAAAEKKKDPIVRNAITKNLPDATKKLQRVLKRRGVEKSISTRSKQEREEAVRELDEMIEAASRLKALIEGIE